MNQRGELTNLSKMLIAFLLVGGILYAGWYFFFAYVDCGDRDCFDSNLAECIRSKYVGGTEMVYEYIILGSSKDSCEVQVTLLQGELNNAESKALEGRQMICEIPEGVVMNPESDIGVCTGELKEGLQHLIIQKLHAYLVQNLGRINLEVLDLPANL